MYKLIFTTLLIMICVSHSHARIYTCKDENGNTIYLDSPSSEICVDAKVEEVKVDKLPTLNESKTYTVPETSEIGLDGEQDSKSAVKDYESLAITTPAKDQTVRSNNGDLNIVFQSAPALQSDFGHRYSLSLNGTEIYRGTKTNFSIQEADRGAYTASVKVVTANGRTLINSETVGFFVQRFSTFQDGIGGGDTSTIPGAGAPIPGGSAPIPGATP